MNDLQTLFASLSDEELLARMRPGALTDVAEAIAREEITSRGLSPPDWPEGEAGKTESSYEGDMTVLERGLTPQEAQLRASFLQSVGIPADAGDVNIVQTHGLLAIAVGGASVRVPEARMQEAADMLAAYKRGEFEL